MNYIMSMKNYCPRCGSELQRRFAEGRDRDVCSQCGFIFYRNPVPAVGVVVALDGQVVLVRRKEEPRAGCWGLPAGYMELDESAEEAAMRECYEETGLLVQIDHLLNVYSYGEGEQTGLVIVYSGSAVGGSMRAGDDALEVGAFSLDALPAPFAFRSHLQAIGQWRRERRPIQVSLAAPNLPNRAIAIRQAQRSDAVFVMELLLGTTADDQGRLAAEALFHDWLHDPDYTILIGELDGQPGGVGMLNFQQSVRGWRANLDELIVEPALRRRGLGRSIVVVAQELARLRGILLLAATPPHDEVTSTFLRACGFKREGWILE